MIDKIFIFVVLILLSGFFSALEIAYFSIGPGVVRTMVRKKKYGALRVEKLKKNPQRLLVVILLGNNLVNIFAASLATDVALGLFGSVGVGIATGVVTFLVLVFGEIFPKATAQIHARVIARYTARFILILQYLLFPVVYLLEKLSGKVARLVPGKHSAMLIKEEDVTSMMHLGEEEGSVEKHEREFVERLFRFNDVKVSSVMTPIKKAVMLDGESLIDQISYFAANSGYSRFPVYKGGKDEIVGIVHLKDLFRALKSEDRDQQVDSIMQKAVYVNEAAELDEALREMQRDKIHYLLVRGAGGKVVGFVTIEDLLEELVGEIYDESDARKISSVT